ncbi:MAG TPA: ChbG/HpnK family deacetylase [Blastocatellia bacterium]|nr:ChbG/HpnK family deacetylase [Blastocatellia bacterium]
MKRLIVNGDDFGFTHGVNTGILRAHKEGILTSATIMANGDAFEEAAGIARQNPSLGVGCHIAIVGGRPVAPPAEIPSLVNDTGLLPRTLGELTRKLAFGTVRISDVQREFRAQLERVLAAGISPTHLDTHKHTHVHPRVMKALGEVAAECGINRIRKPFQNWRLGLRGPAAKAANAVYLKQYAMAFVVRPSFVFFRRTVVRHRLHTPDWFYGVSLTGLLDAEAVVQILSQLPSGTSELMCHPGLCDADLEQSHTRLKHSRELELAALIDSRVRCATTEQGIDLIDYRDLGN